MIWCVEFFNFPRERLASFKLYVCELTMANRSVITDLESSLEKALNLFREIPKLKDEQRQCLRQLLIENRDVLAVLPTGYGKSIVVKRVSGAPRVRK